MYIFSSCIYFSHFKERNNRSEDERKSTWPIGGKNISFPEDRHAGQVPYEVICHFHINSIKICVKTSPQLIPQESVPILLLLIISVMYVLVFLQ